MYTCAIVMEKEWFHADNVSTKNKNENSRPHATKTYY